MIDPDLKKIADHYGLKHQLWKTIEELWELIVAILAYLILGKTERRLAHIVEEATDVLLMVNQILYLLGVRESEISNWATSKVVRQLKRMENVK